ncbi:tRNA pseudouridine(55) synthase TruB [Janibacter cremeus]|uniref:tRNA pseudouridine(55) synthase TruB n=1 Tax=Janibacter cremeus TaxID=1285192 RepID=UPI0023F6C1FA|nr:tRNA pseudouridine(55) synthase TruB [Janibacter cremeus]WEV78569.1 tRNA pseudouridine(55) synthase TruB [Janibacter cremeus]
MSDGLVVVDKPAGWSSHDVVARSRRLYGTRKVGHAGTLDPMATGVLVLGVGRGTKLLTFLVGADKAYTATIRLGQATITDDAEGEVTATGGVTGIDRPALEAAITRLTGDIEQVPSSVSAIKVKGERSYARVRAGEDVELPARPVTVSRFDLLDVREASSGSTAGPGGAVGVLDVDVEVEVSSGTYVRALARDLGADLGCHGHLTALRRTRVGGLTLEHSHTLEELAALRDGGTEPADLPMTPLADAARAALVQRELTAEQARSLGFGQRIPSALPGRQEPVGAFAPDGSLVAVLDETRPTARAHVVFAPASS